MPSARHASAQINLTADDLNLHYSKVATDSEYDAAEMENVLKSMPDNSESDKFTPYSADLFAIILSKLNSTSPGPDGIPFWLYKTCSAQLSLVMSKLVNFSITKGLVPNVWRTAHITPIPKSSPITGPADYRPISVTPIFARLTEKILVRDFLLPHILPQSFKDQYAFKPTGSTTCALIDLTYRVQMMLEKCKYVRCVFVDFSKAFDVVDHRILLQKLIFLRVPNFIICWIKSYLSGRMHATKFNDLLSRLAAINRSVVQGSGLGPVLFIIYACDLITIDELNYLLKYADDITLLNPENASISAESEMENIMNWAKQNKMVLNMVKTKEMVFHRPNPRLVLLPGSMDCIERVTEFKLLGVYLKPDLNFGRHISALVTQCNQRLYLIWQLKKQGLGIEECDNILHALVLSRIRYALPMFYKYLSTDMISKLNAVFRKARKWQLTSKLYDLHEIAETVQQNLFQQSKRSGHCLNHLYVVKNEDESTMKLRKRGHDYVLPAVKYDFSARSFVVNSLFKFR